MTKPFQYKIPKTNNDVGNVNRVSAPAEQEVFTGYVLGMPASSLEERWYRSMLKDRTIRSFEFQPSFFAGRNVPGEVRPDFLIEAGANLVVQIDGEYAHKTAEQKATDQMKDALLDGYLSGYGYMPTIRIPGDLLDTQENSDKVEREVVENGRLL
jgi:very-short-patch-repair endonuclease